MRNRFVPRLVVTAILLLGGGEGIADVIYETDPPDPSEVWPIRWRYDPPLNNSSFGVSAMFPVAAGMSYRLTSVTLPLAHQSGSTNLEIALFSNIGDLPGILLETIVPNPTSIAEESAFYAFGSSLFPVLEGGSSYWLVVQPHDLDSTNGEQNAIYQWNTAFFQQGLVGVRNHDFAANDWGSWSVGGNPFPAFRIDGTAVPEPNSWAMFTVGGLLFWFGAQRKKK